MEDNTTRQIALLGNIGKEVASIQSIPVAKDMRDKAEALRTYAKNAGLSLEMQNKCAEVRLRYERRAGELLIEYGVSAGNPQLSSTRTIEGTPTLTEFGINRNQSSRWQQIALIPEFHFEKFLEETKARIAEITTAAALKVYRECAGVETRADVLLTDPPPVTPSGVVVQGDMIKVLAEMDRGFADLIVTDPPYGRGESADIEFETRENMSKPAGAWDDPGVVAQFGEWARMFKRALKPDGSLYCFVFDRYIGQMRLALEEHGFSVEGPHIWMKTNPPPSVRKGSYRSNYECLLYAKAGPKFTFNWLGQDRMKKCVVFPTCGGGERLDHPTQKPVKLLREYIEVSSNEGDLVLDPFAGVGSTAVAAAELGRRYLLIERDDYYYKQACIRLQQEIRPTANVF